MEKFRGQWVGTYKGWACMRELFPNCEAVWDGRVDWGRPHVTFALSFEAGIRVGLEGGAVGAPSKQREQNEQRHRGGKSLLALSSRIKSEFSRISSRAYSV